ncbi:acyl-CoA synthetase [soil metagenome]
MSQDAESVGPVIHSGDRTLTHAELETRAARAATGFASLGVAAGDAVAILMRNDIAFLEASRAAAMLGAYAVPLNWHFAAAELAYVVGDCDARVLVAHADLLSLLDGASLPQRLVLIGAEPPAEVRDAYAVTPDRARVPDSMPDWSNWLEGFEPWTEPVAVRLESVIYTSGTTGKPKGVRRQMPTPEQQLATAEMRAQVYGLTPGIRLIVPAPLYHGAPNVFAMRALLVAEALVLMPRFDAEALLQAIERYRATTIVMVPTMFVRLLRLPPDVRARYDLSSLQRVFHAAAPCPPEVKRDMIDWWGPIICEWYGTTESSAVTWVDSADWLAHPGTVGRPIKGARVEVVGDDGRLQPAGVPGEIYMGLDFYPDFTYHKRDDDRQRIGRGGLITGGDIGYLDDDGFLYLCDRKRDMIISGGVNIYPAELESAILSLPQAQDCAVIGIPDVEYGEAVLALVVPTDGQAPADEASRLAYIERLQTELKSTLARYKLPRRIELRESLPRDDAGKLLKRRLREPYWQDQGRAI